MTNDKPSVGETGLADPNVLDAPAELARATAFSAAPMPPGPASGGTEHAVNPLVVVHGMLRGRYPLAIALACALGITGALVGYRAKVPVYRSEGTLRVKPSLPRILYQTEQSSLIPMFEAYLGSQVEVIRSRRSVERAIALPEWSRLGRGSGQEAVLGFVDALEVTSPGSQLIKVAFTDRDPQAAAAAVNAVIETYVKTIGDGESDTALPATGVLEERRDALQSELNQKNEQIRKIAVDYGATALQQVYEFKLADLNKLESQLRLAQLNLAAGEARDADAAANPNAGAPTRPLLTEQEMAEYAHEKRELQRKLRQLAQRFGPNHPQVAEVQAMLRDVDTELEQAVLAPAQDERNGSASPDEGGAAGSGTRTRSGAISMNATLPDGTPLPSTSRLRAIEERIRQLYNSVKQETLDLGRRNLEIERVRADADEIRARLNETRQRLEQLNLERNVSGRVEVISDGEVPLQPYRDKRKQLAAGGGMGGAALGVGLVLLLGLRDRRKYYIVDAQTKLVRSERLFGVMPEMPSTPTAEQSRLAAHCVHHFRGLLQLRQRTTGRKVFAITSPSPSDGKTSVTTALGVSLASSGSRTLLVDGDLQGGGLTAKMGGGNRAKLGHILIRKGLISEQQLSESLVAASQWDLKLGEAAGRLGHIDREAVSSALGTQDKVALGMRDVLAGLPLHEALVPTSIPSLYILPRGVAGTGAQMSPESLRRIIDQVRGQFDAVLIDSGPVLGCVEASIIAAEADGAFLVVQRGGARDLVDRATDVLNHCGSNLEGLVFNRASGDDLLSTGYSSSTSRPVEPEDWPGARSSPAVRRQRLGPVGNAVMSESGHV